MTPKLAALCEHDLLIGYECESHGTVSLDSS